MFRSSGLATVTCYAILPALSHYFLSTASISRFHLQMKMKTWKLIFLYVFKMVRDDFQKLDHSLTFESGSITSQVFYWHIPKDFSSSRWDNILLIQFPLARPLYTISHWVSPHPHPWKKDREETEWRREAPRPGHWKRQAEKTPGTHHQPFKVRSFAQWAVVLGSVWLCWAWWHRLIILSIQGVKTEGSQVQVQPGQLSKGLTQSKGNL